MDSRLDFAPAGYLSFTDDGIITSLNHTLSGWLGYNGHELTGKNIETIFTLATRIFYNTHFFPLVKLHGRANEVFVTLCARDKKDIPVLTNAERRLENETYTTHCIFIPLYQRRKYEDEILNAKRQAESALNENKHLQELKESLETRTLELDRQVKKLLTMNGNLLQFSKIVSHDLHEPLRKIQIFTDVIATGEREKLTTKSLSAIRKINASAERLKQLISGLQQYIIVDEEKLYADVDLNEVLNNARSRAVLKRNFNDFDMVAEKLPVIQGYKTQLELMFFNLIDNAIQFRDISHRLMIRISSVFLDENVYRVTMDKYKFSEHLRIIFTDNGIGFESKYRDYVFELLKKINPVTEGLGIGLSLIKKIVDNHSGTLSVDSENGKGTSFTIVLPVKIS